MDFAYNDEQKEIIKVVRDLVEKEIVPYASEMDETGKLHEGLLDKLAAQGLLGVAIPEEFGGAGLDAITIAAIYEELGKGCAGFSTTVAANALASYPVIIAGNDDQKKRYFDIINEDNLAAFALTEPGTGSDAGSVSTRAMKTGKAISSMARNASSPTVPWPKSSSSSPIPVRAAVSAD